MALQLTRLRTGKRSLASKVFVVAVDIIPSPLCKNGWYLLTASGRTAGHRRPRVLRCKQGAEGQARGTAAQVSLWHGQEIGPQQGRPRTRFAAQPPARYASEPQ